MYGNFTKKYPYALTKANSTYSKHNEAKFELQTNNIERQIVYLNIKKYMSRLSISGLTFKDLGHHHAHPHKEK